MAVRSGLIGAAVTAVIALAALACMGFEATDGELQAIWWPAMAVGFLVVLWLESRRHRSPRETGRR